jgi:hypothetical protein
MFMRALKRLPDSLFDASTPDKIHTASLGN